MAATPVPINEDKNEEIVPFGVAWTNSVAKLIISFYCYVIIIS